MNTRKWKEDPELEKLMKQNDTVIIWLMIGILAAVLLASKYCVN